ncbi:hypothetical protein [Methanoculleus sp. 7T]|uniref:hypothetical protein n=1 Tax=Methanoculleus sp. 7T TaxID=2937282 RepID=UPI0020C11A49|nr:hypothetical protein [Methanoculleus sp. 7T]MCK8519484.1 hypothetical protein [Methanoculleus sp. 7T]
MRVDDPRVGLDGRGTPEMTVKETKKASTRVTKAEKIQRIDLISELLSQGFTRGKILQYVSEKEAEGTLAWHVSERHIDNYIRDATALFGEVARAHNNQRFGRALTRLDYLYAQSIAINDYKTALAVVKAEVDLIGLTPPKKIEADVNLTTPEGLLALFRTAGKEIEKAWAEEERRPDPDDEDLDEA